MTDQSNHPTPPAASDDDTVVWHVDFRGDEQSAVWHDVDLIPVLNDEVEGARLEALPRFPAGTAEYEAYREELVGELKKFAVGEPPYGFPHHQKAW